MKTALITGFNARAGSARRALRDVSFASLLASALRDNGWTVDHGDRPITDNLSSYDAVFVGIASPVALSSNRAYVALAAIGHAHAAGKCVLFLDDPDVGKVVHGLDSLHRSPDRLTSTFFKARPGYEVASTPEWTAWLLDATNTLRTHQWPTLLIPAHAWADVGYLTARLRPEMRVNAQIVDLSRYMPEYTPPAAEAGFERSRAHEWVTEASWVLGQGLTMPIRHLGEKVRDETRVAEYAKSWAVIEPPTSQHGAGWFTPNMVYAQQAGAVYCTDWRDVQGAGPAFTMLPHAIEDLSVTEHADLVEQQRQQFLASSWDATEVSKWIEGVV